MINDKKVLALIPARGGSKRLPGKNILPLNGIPLIAWTINSAKGSEFVDKVVVSTDDTNISKISVEFGAEVPFLRPKSLASDTATSNDAILHAIGSLKEQFDIIVVLQPTSPFRTSNDIDMCLTMLVERGGDGVVSVTQCEHSPLWSNVLPSDGSMNGFLSDAAKKRGQDLATYYRLNGAIYSYTIESIALNRGISFNKKVFSYIMSQRSSIDIDALLDFQLAELIASKN